MRNKTVEGVLATLIVLILMFGAKKASEHQSNLSYQRDQYFVKYIDTRIALDRKEHAIEHISAVLSYAETYEIRPSMAEQIIKAADRWGIPHNLAFRLVYIESKFNPRAVSHKGAVGIAQVKPSTASMYRVTTHSDLYDVNHNLDVAFRYLSDLKMSRKTWYEALRAYNAGPDRSLRDMDISTGYAQFILEER